MSDMLVDLRRKVALWICPELVRSNEAANPMIGPAVDRAARDLCRLIKVCAVAKNRSPSTISRLATGSGDTVKRLERNRRITTERAATAILWLSDNWPDDLPWPSDIPRPAKKGAGA